MKNIIDDINESFVTSRSGEIYENAINYIDKILIETALERSRGNQLMAAKILGLNRNTLHTKLKKLNIDAQRFKR